MAKFSGVSPKLRAHWMMKSQKVIVIELYSVVVSWSNLFFLPFKLTSSRVLNSTMMETCLPLVTREAELSSSKGTLL